MDEQPEIVQVKVGRTTEAPASGPVLLKQSAQRLFTLVRIMSLMVRMIKCTQKKPQLHLRMNMVAQN